VFGYSKPFHVKFLGYELRMAQDGVENVSMGIQMVGSANASVILQIITVERKVREKKFSHSYRAS